MSLKGIPNLFIVAAVGIGAFMVARKMLAGQEQAIANRARAMAYDATTTSTTTNIDDLKNQTLTLIYQGALNPAAVINNLTAVKAELDNYTTKLTTLATEKAAGRISDSIVTYYLQTIAKEIADKLHIEWKTNATTGNYDDWTYNHNSGYPYYPYPYPYGGGGSGGSGGGGSQYQDLYNQYLQYLQQIQGQYGGQYGYPSYGYSYGYGYQQPYMQPINPIQNYNYYPQYGMSSPYGYANMGGNYYSNYYPQQQQQSYYPQQSYGQTIMIGPNQQGIYY